MVRPDLLLDSALAGVSAGCMTILMTAPFRYAGPAVVCGLSGRLIRDLLLAAAVSPPVSTLAATTAVVLLAVALAHGKEVSPVVVITGILPLGASLSMFQTVVYVLRLPSRTGAAATETSMELITTLSRVVTTSMAIALGLVVGIAVARALHRFGVARA